MTDVQWTLWVFAGPGALCGLVRSGDGIELAEVPPGEPPPLAATLARLLGPGVALPPGVELLAEVMGEPTLLQQLTGQWPTARLVGNAEHSVVQPSPAELGERDLRRFVAWADERTAQGSRRALLVLGDVLRALGDVPGPLGSSPGGGRPTYPTTIVIKKNTTNTSGQTESVTETYRRDPSGGTYSGISTSALLSRAQSSEVTAIDGQGSITATDGSLDELVALP
ncbi:MAG: hypothetical protein KDK70_24490, partial [Myxococcales bacterium]|nr:hypothetical protein [Myxococcales bacterium]